MFLGILAYILVRWNTDGSFSRENKVPKAGGVVVSHELQKAQRYAAEADAKVLAAHKDMVRSEKEFLRTNNRTKYTMATTAHSDAAYNARLAHSKLITLCTPPNQTAFLPY